jgi:lysozyme family protein
MKTVKKRSQKAKRPSVTRRKVQPGRPRNEDVGKTFQAQKPWIAEGCCRATWYNRRRAMKKEARA